MRKTEKCTYSRNLRLAIVSTVSYLTPVHPDARASFLPKAILIAQQSVVFFIPPPQRSLPNAEPTPSPESAA